MINILALANTLLSILHIPHRLVNRLRRVVICRGMVSVGRNFVFDVKSTFIMPNKVVSVGNDVLIGPQAHILAWAKIHIGDGCILGPQLLIIAGDHKYDAIGKMMHETLSIVGESADIYIGNDVWCGARVTILKGVTIGDGAIIGAGSIVTKDIPPYTVAAGNPAKAIKPRFSMQDLDKHLEILHLRERRLLLK